MAIIVSDTFTRTNSSSAGTTETGGLTWVGYGGATGATDGSVLYGTGVKVGDLSFVAVDISISDNYEVSTKFISSTADFAALIFRATDANNFWHVQVLNDGSYIIESISGGSYINFGSSAAGLFTSGDVIKVKVVGTTITVYRNGTQLTALNITSSVNLTATKVGVAFFNTTGTTGNRFDDFTVDNLSGGSGTPGSTAYATKQVINRTASTAYATKQAINQTASAAFATKQIISAVGLSAFATKQTISQVGSIAYATQQTITDGGIPGSVACSTKQIINLTATLLVATRQTVYQVGSSEWATKQSIMVFVEIVETVDLSGTFILTLELRGRQVLDVYLQGTQMTLELRGRQALDINLQGTRILDVYLRGAMR